jgi:hypothetical protein
VREVVHEAERHATAAPAASAGASRKKRLLGIFETRGALV